MLYFIEQFVLFIFPLSSCTTRSPNGLCTILILFCDSISVFSSAYFCFLNQFLYTFYCFRWRMDRVLREKRFGSIYHQNLPNIESRCGSWLAHQHTMQTTHKYMLVEIETALLSVIKDNELFWIWLIDFLIEMLRVATFSLRLLWLENWIKIAWQLFARFTKTEMKFHQYVVDMHRKPIFFCRMCVCTHFTSYHVVICYSSLPICLSIEYISQFSQYKRARQKNTEHHRILQQNWKRCRHYGPNGSHIHVQTLNKLVVDGIVF